MLLIYVVGKKIEVCFVIQTHDFCDTSAALKQVKKQDKWEIASHFVGW